MKPEHPSHNRDVPGADDPDARGTPVGRRVLLGTLG
ncbi:oxidoreductase, partial [Streptomyces sp. SID4956]|nr:oxidoreductase [Streptomyces sp. SID4956]